jgi:hypothetical protein|eukprot:evm.model.NODE_32400_length_7759_cov_39.428921.2
MQDEPRRQVKPVALSENRVKFGRAFALGASRRFGWCTTGKVVSCLCTRGRAAGFEERGQPLREYQWDGGGVAEKEERKYDNNKLAAAAREASS